jgi:hypothetical protein
MPANRPRLLPSAERYAVRPAQPEPHIDPNAIERSVLYLAAAELIDPAIPTAPARLRSARTPRRRPSP